MLEKGLTADWKPEKAKFALVTSAGGHMTAFVDPGFPGAWRKSPYFETLKRWSLEGLRASGRLSRDNEGRYRVTG